MKTKSALVIDDTTLDKPYAEKIAIVSSHWLGKHHAVATGVNFILLLWTDGKTHLPCDFRLYNYSHGRLTKNDRFQNMLYSAQERGFTPELVAFDGWYNSLENLKTDASWFEVKQIILFARLSVLTSNILPTPYPQLRNP